MGIRFASQARRREHAERPRTASGRRGARPEKAPLPDGSPAGSSGHARRSHERPVVRRVSTCGHGRRDAMVRCSRSQACAVCVPSA
eukprot:4386141-Prymnesium_polylepis.1